MLLGSNPWARYGWFVHLVLPSSFAGSDIFSLRSGLKLKSIS